MTFRDDHEAALQRADALESELDDEKRERERLQAEVEQLRQTAARDAARADAAERALGERTASDEPDFVVPEQLRIEQAEAEAASAANAATPVEPEMAQAASDIAADGDPVAVLAGPIGARPEYGIAPRSDGRGRELVVASAKLTLLLAPLVTLALWPSTAVWLLPVVLLAALGYALARTVIER